MKRSCNVHLKTADVQKKFLLYPVHTLDIAIVLEVASALQNKTSVKIYRTEHCIVFIFLNLTMGDLVQKLQSMQKLQISNSILKRYQTFPGLGPMPGSSTVLIELSAALLILMTINLVRTRMKYLTLMLLHLLCTTYFIISFGNNEV